MELASIIDQYYEAYRATYASTILPSHLKAIDSIRSCRTPDSGELYVRCTECDHTEWRPLSCGHRSCPKCQNHEASEWIDRQQIKLLPVNYYMITFTLPYELRGLVWRNQRKVYSIFFDCVASTLKDFGLNPKNLGAEIGITMVLHTNSRVLNFHPHIHAVVPGGGVDKSRRQFKKKKGKYLFNHDHLAAVFRAKFLEALNKAKLPIPYGAPREWVVDCTKPGRGINALKYLSRYLYRGVISEKDIVSNQNGQVTFRYINNDTGNTEYKTVKGEKFLQLVFQHVLPKGFRRVRDYGFLHSNAKTTRFLIQLLLHVQIEEIEKRPRPAFKCPCCKQPMIVIGVRRGAWKAG